MAFDQESRLLVAVLAACLLPGAIAMASAGEPLLNIQWKGGQGNWGNAANWGGGALPMSRSRVWIVGKPDKSSDVTLAHGEVLVHVVEITEHHATLTVDGASLTSIYNVTMGNRTGSDGRFLLKSGSLFTGAVYVAGGGGPGQRGTGVAEIRGGSLVAKVITLGACAGSHCTLRVVGSKATAIAVEDGISMGVYNYLLQEKEPPPSESELVFDLDADGVTPIFAWGKTEGSVRFPIPQQRPNGFGSCRLRIALLAPPPSGDILLVGCAKRCSGAFTDVPEGGAVRAELDGKTYQWRLTYRGGESKCDIVLTSPCRVTPEGKKVPYVTGKKAKGFRFDPGVVESAYRHFYSRIDAEKSPLGSGTPAFPGAEGFGRYAKGGRGGKVLSVTNLNDSGPGSLRAAIETKGPRTVIFRVSGLIETKGLAVREPYITIAGQTAPGDGICIRATKGGGDAFGLTGTHDVIVRYLRVRAGSTDPSRAEPLVVDDSENFMIDHCSASWGNSMTLVTRGINDLYTVQWCIASETNNENRHAFGGAVSGIRCSWHHNLYAHLLSRVPRWGSITTQADFRNNVMYDWGHTCSYGDFRSLNYVNNYLRRGPSTTQNPPLFIAGPRVALPHSLYIDGNVMEGLPQVTKDNWKGVGADVLVRAREPFPFAPVETQPAAEAMELILRNAGATLPKRDPVDARIVSDVRNGTGKIIDNEKDVGGWPKYESAPALEDSDHDGIPDRWETVHGLNPRDASDANAVDRDGYTHLERYLNSLIPAHGG